MNQIDRPLAIRLSEVEGQILDVMDERASGPERSIALGALDTAMDARGYSGRAVLRAVESLIGKGVLGRAGSGYLQRLADPPTAAMRRRRPAPRRPRRNTGL
ncbi:hypothetical protein FHP25_33625 [Vineibacter terrae]|uniref:Uncharacterized protein n=1 Tax=Vineibacter terrae TaxID=2586908 RepID=A0A5C8P9X0_9HYPH|nr:hypothetical protein [Vineibacter terrae]TXL70596.1 hypothetical protein FHP25_33625 [Vineibacter terrae]